MSIANPYKQVHGGGGDPAQLKLRRQVTIASLSVAMILIAAKLVAYIVTDSVSVMTSLLDSTFDAVASAVTMISVLHAATPADEEHRFGHGKIEALAALAQSIFIFGSAGYLFFEAAHRFVHPQPVKAAEVGIWVMLLSIVLTVILVKFQRYVIGRTQSVAIRADNFHYTGDLLMNLGVLAALALGLYYPWPYFDSLFAAGVSVALLVGAWKIARESYAILMDEELPAADREKIEALVKAHPRTRAIHDLRTRSNGQHIFIEFHLEMDGALTLSEAHDATEEIELMIYKAFPAAEVLIHQEPAGIDDHRLDHNLKGGQSA